MDGDEHGRDILYSNQDILMADLVEEACIPNKRTWKTEHEEHCLPRTVATTVSSGHKDTSNVHAYVAAFHWL